MISSITKQLFKIATVPALALAALAAGCDHGAEPAGPLAPQAAAVAPSQPKAQDVTIDNFSFSPPTLTVAAGSTITWVNHDDIPHTVTANDKGFSSGALDTDQKFSHTFTAAGTYAYFCSVHPHMTGQIVVK